MIRKFKIYFQLFTAAFLLTLSSTAQEAKKQISLDDIWVKYSFYPNSIRDLRSLNDGIHYTTLENGVVNEYSYETGEKTRELLGSAQLKINGSSEAIEISDYQFSDNETRVLISTDEESIYRHSSKSQSYVYDLRLKKLYLVAEGKKQQLSCFSPDGSKLAYVRDNNLYLYDIDAATEKAITTDGEMNKIINGAPDWVYEEEFGFAKGFHWSPDGKKIAFYHYDESNVKEYTMISYDSLYPTLVKYKYPKAGEDNSVIQIKIYNLENNNTIIADIGTEKDIYIPRILWTQDPNTLCIMRMNRLQNKLEFLLTDGTSGASKVIYTETNKYYIEIGDNLSFLKNGKQFIWTSEADGYNHIYLFDMNGKLVNQITKGLWDIADICSIDETGQFVYFTAAAIKPMQKELYSVKFSGKGLTQLSKQAGTNQASFSKTSKYYLLTYSNANQPPVISLFNVKGKLIRVMEDNKAIADKMKNYNFSVREFYTFKTADNIDLNGWMIKPPDFDPNKKYPVFMTLYGGPNSQTVEDQWDYMDTWHQMIAQKGYIVVSVDNRGTGFRGEEFRKCTYKQLGKIETYDQIEAAKYLGSLPYVDAKRIGIYGWSYGGFMSLSCLLKGNDVFKLAMAVAPVTNWRYYDNIYTERFMQKPQDNPKGYDENSPLNFAHRLTGKLLVIHGTTDDNVHTQNTYELMKVFTKANKQFDMQMYTNKNHFINGGKTRLHLFTKMTDYLLENL
jgi:dipeptidyl-peptidase-4